VGYLASSVEASKRPGLFSIRRTSVVKIAFYFAIKHCESVI
jgi:hypothetical protein